MGEQARQTHPPVTVACIFGGAFKSDFCYFYCCLLGYSDGAFLHISVR